MPIIKVSIAEGKSHDELRGLIGALHQAVEQHVEATPDGTTVLIEEYPRAHWSRGNVTIAERRGKYGRETHDFICSHRGAGRAGTR